jgi:hypothetical protein
MQSISVEFIRQNYINMIIELSSLPINLWVSLVAFYNSSQGIGRSRLCLSRSVMPVKYQLNMSVTVCGGRGPKFYSYTSKPLLDRFSQAV